MEAEATAFYETIEGSAQRVLEDVGGVYIRFSGSSLFLHVAYFHVTVVHLDLWNFSMLSFL